MKILIFARYGQWENSHLNTEGIKTMDSLAKKIKKITGESKITAIMSADIPRAYESANIIAKHLGVQTVKKFPELYAAEEDGLLPDISKAYSRISSEGESNDVIIVVLSREYTEVLPKYISNTIFNKETKFNTSLQRGEAILINYKTQEIALI